MKQLTLRVDEALAADLKSEAARRGESVNTFAAKGLTALVDPDAAGDDVAAMRERLRRAGLLAEMTPTHVQRPTEAEMKRARDDARRGRPLSDYVIEGRG